MQKKFALLIRGIKGEELSLEVFSSNDEHIEEGVLWESDEYWYPIIGGVPCLLRGGLRPDHTEFRVRHDLPVIPDGHKNDAVLSQSATTVTFSDKWSKFRNYGLEPAHGEFLFNWYCKKLGLNDLASLEKFYAQKNSILEVGPGSGFNTRFMAQQGADMVVALDISEAAYTTYFNTRDLSNCHVVQADLMDAPFDDSLFDFIIADGVLHHTPDTRKAVETLYRKLAPGGEFFFYVYKQMGPMRRFCDEHIRAEFTKLEPDACYKQCEGITELGRELSKLNASVVLEHGIPILGIPPGTHNVQRLIYYNFIKCFWNDAFDFETNNMVNFDWYHPHNAWQHTEKEVMEWLECLGVENYSFNEANPNGISVLLQKPS